MKNTIDLTKTISIDDIKNFNVPDLETLDFDNDTENAARIATIQFAQQNIDVLEKLPENETYAIYFDVTVDETITTNYIEKFDDDDAVLTIINVKFADAVEFDDFLDDDEKTPNLTFSK